MCHKLVALHVWTHTGGRFRGASGSISLAIVCGNYFAVCGTTASTYYTTRGAQRRRFFLKNANSWALRDDQSGKSRTLP